MLKLGDVLLIGTYTYTVIGVKGAWAVIQWRSKDGIFKQTVIKQARSVQLQAA